MSQPLSGVNYEDFIRETPIAYALRKTFEAIEIEKSLTPLQRDETLTEDHYESQ